MYQTIVEKKKNKNPAHFFLPFEKGQDDFTTSSDISSIKNDFIL